MKKFLALLLSVVMVCSLAVPALAADTTDIAVTGAQANKVTFPDSLGHWAEESISRWALNGVVRGDPQGNMNPNKLLTRGEFSEMLVRLLGLSEKATNKFADLKGSEWYADSVLKVAAAGIMLGDELGNCNGNKPISRQETIVMFARAMGLKPVSNPDLSEYSDGNEVASWAAGYIAPLTKMGILNGTVPGKMVADPKANINRASTLALLDKAVRIYITTPGEYEVNEPNGFVVVNVPTDGDVTVSGKASGVVITAGTNDADVTVKDMAADTIRVDGTADVTLDGETEVGSVAVNAEGNLVIGEKAAVEDLDVNAAAQIVNNGEVTNLNTNEDGVTFDGNAPETVNTAEDTEPAKDSKGNEVAAKGEEEEKPDNSGTSTVTPSRPTSYKYKVSVASATGGKVTADVTQTNEANKEVTLTVTPDPQKGSTMPYVLKSLTVKRGETAVAVNGNKFTMDTEGTYTVTAEFVQPITKAVMYVANGTDKTAVDMEADGYYEGDVTDETLAQYPYFFIGMTKNTAEGVGTYTISDFTLTANGKTVTPLPWGTPSNIFKFASAYVGDEKPSIDPHEGADMLNLTGSAYTFVLTFKVGDAEYELTCDYVKPGVTAADLKTITFKTSTGKVLATYKGAAEETVTVPTHPELDGYYFAGWDKDATDGADYPIGVGGEVTANYVEVTDTILSVRMDGPEGNHGPVVEDFKYRKVYTAAGLTMEGSKITVDATKLTAMVKSTDENLAHIMGNGGLENTVVFGVAYQTPPEAKKVAFAGKLENLPAAEDYRILAEHSSCYNNTLISYIPVATIDPETKEITFMEDGVADSDFCKWVDDNGKVVAVTKTVINIETNNFPAPPAPATYTVTFKDGEAVVKTVENVEAGATVAIPEGKEILTAEGKGFLGWYVGETKYDGTAPITEDTVVTAKWMDAANVSDVNVSITGAAAKLSITANEYAGGEITYTVDKAKATDEVVATLNGILYVRVNFAVPEGVDENWTFVGSTNNGKTWRGTVNPFTAFNLSEVGLDTTKDENGKITHLGQWFGIATVTDGKISFTESATWTILYKWTDSEGNVQFTTFKLHREVIDTEAEENA